MTLHISGQFVSDSGTYLKTAERFPAGWCGTCVQIGSREIKAKHSDRYGYDLLLEETGDFTGTELLLNESDIDYSIGRFNDPRTMLPEPKRTDWIKLYRRNPDRRAAAQKYLWIADVFPRKKYRQFWARAIFPNRIRLLKRNGKFLPKQLDRAGAEAQKLLAWCKAQRQSDNNYNYLYMARQIQALMQVITAEAPNSSEPFYIF